MAGRGPVPKHPSVRARRNAHLAGVRELPLVREEPPELPSLGVDDAGKERAWHPRTVEWWAKWRDSELSRDFTVTDWSFLVDTALMHHTMWAEGKWALAAEVRLRVAKFGATPEDRARLRITFADAEERDERRAARSARSSRSGQVEEEDPRRALYEDAGR